MTFIPRKFSRGPWTAAVQGPTFFNLFFGSPVPAYGRRAISFFKPTRMPLRPKTWSLSYHLSNGPCRVSSRAAWLRARAVDDPIVGGHSPTTLGGGKV